MTNGEVFGSDPEFERLAEEIRGLIRKRRQQVAAQLPDSQVPDVKKQMEQVIQANNMNIFCEWLLENRGTLREQFQLNANGNIETSQLADGRFSLLSCVHHNETPLPLQKGALVYKYTPGEIMKTARQMERIFPIDFRFDDPSYGFLSYTVGVRRSATMH